MQLSISAIVQRFLKDAEIDGLETQRPAAISAAPEHFSSAEKNELVMNVPD
jgi:hypothetical protein